MAADLISIVITVRNEEHHIADLLDSLVVQEPPVEIIVVDSESDDRTRVLTREYCDKYDFVQLHRRGGTRGKSRNFGVAQAKGKYVAFIDGDCIANPFWIKELREELQKADVVAGKTIQIGYRPFESLHRVELYKRGYDVTFPSCNLAYRRDLFEKLEGFDDWFRTAEDIDLNIRAVDAGAKVIFNERAIVYHRARDTIPGFLKQALWNGFGRKQLTLKHGRLWSQYSFKKMLTSQLTFWGITRLFVAVGGYLLCAFTEKLPPTGSAPK